MQGFDLKASESRRKVASVVLIVSLHVCVRRKNRMQTIKSGKTSRRLSKSAAGKDVGQAQVAQRKGGSMHHKNTICR